MRCSLHALKEEVVMQRTLRSFSVLALVPAALVCIVSAAPARAETYFGFQLGITNAPPPPRAVFYHEPEVVYVPSCGVHVVAHDPGYDVFHYGSYWYMANAGFWYRSSSYRGPWRACDARYVPRRIYSVPAGYWRHSHWAGRGYGRDGGYARYRNDRWHGQRAYKRDRGDWGNRRWTRGDDGWNRGGTRHRDDRRDWGNRSWARGDNSWNRGGSRYRDDRARSGQRQRDWNRGGSRNGDGHWNRERRSGRSQAWGPGRGERQFAYRDRGDNGGRRELRNHRRGGDGGSRRERRRSQREG
jgi:hypothetical protein